MENQPQSQPSQTLFVKVIYAYMLGMHILLPVILFVIFPAKNIADAEQAVSAAPSSSMIPDHYQDPKYLLIYVFAICAWACAFIIPKLLGRRGATRVMNLMAQGRLNETNKISQVFSIYIVRLVFFEVTTLCGFVAGFLSEQPMVIVPFAALGLLGALLSRPTPSFLNSLSEG